MVQPDPNPNRASSGWFKLIAVTADAIQRRGVKLAPVIIKVWDVHIDLNKFLSKGKLVCYAKGRDYYFAKLSEADLNRALRLKKNMPIKNVKAYLRDGRIIFTGVYHLAFGHRLRLEGKLVPKKGSEVHFIPTRASVNGIPIPAGPLRLLMRKLNPLLDMKNVPLHPTVRSIVIRNGYLTISG